MKQDPEEGKKYMAMGCVGSRNRNEPKFHIPSDHVYKIVEESKEEDEGLIGWMSLDKAIEKFGKDNVVESSTSRHCPVCTYIRKPEIREKILNRQLSISDILRQFPNIISLDQILEYVTE